MWQSWSFCKGSFTPRATIVFPLWSCHHFKIYCNPTIWGCVWFPPAHLQSSTIHAMYARIPLHQVSRTFEHEHTHTHTATSQVEQRPPTFVLGFPTFFNSFATSSHGTIGRWHLNSGGFQHWITTLRCHEGAPGQKRWIARQITGITSLSQPNGNQSILQNQDGNEKKLLVQTPLASFGWFIWLKSLGDLRGFPNITDISTRCWTSTNIAMVNGQKAHWLIEHEEFSFSCSFTTVLYIILLLVP